MILKTAPMFPGEPKKPTELYNLLKYWLQQWSVFGNYANKRNAASLCGAYLTLLSSIIPCSLRGDGEVGWQNMPEHPLRLQCSYLLSRSTASEAKPDWGTSARRKGIFITWNTVSKSPRAITLCCHAAKSSVHCMLASCPPMRHMCTKKQNPKYIDSSTAEDLDFRFSIRKPRDSCKRHMQRLWGNVGSSGTQFYSPGSKVRISCKIFANEARQVFFIEI